MLTRVHSKARHILFLLLLKTTGITNHYYQPTNSIVKNRRANFSRDFEKNLPWRIPEYFGITRKFESKVENGKETSCVVYTTKCRKEIRNERELETWFIMVKMKPSDLNFTNFDFNPQKNMSRKFVITKPGENVVYPDLSGGRENFNIPVVAVPKHGKNYRPPKILYPRVKALPAPLPEGVTENDYKGNIVEKTVDFTLSW